MNMNLFYILIFYFSKYLMTASISVKQSLPTTKLQSKEFDPKPYMKSGLKDSQVR
jgi:hypothetical protein